MRQIKVIIAALMLTPFAAQATLIDFVAMPDGNITTIGDATFSLAGVGEIGDPYVDSLFGGGLWNSVDGALYPTNTILRVDFDSGVQNLMWTFDNEGPRPTTWTIYNSALAVLATGSNATLGGFQNYDLSAYSDVRRIEWNNLGNDWLFAVGQIEYDSVSVPEPGTLALLGIGLAGMGLARRRKKV